MACLSVRTGFDLLLEALNLPANSEVLMSAISIAEMSQIIEAHDLVPVPVDIDPDTLQPRLEHLQEAVTPRSRVLLVAHLFGSRMDVGPLQAFAAEHRLLLIEDCAQAFTGSRNWVDPQSLVAMFSFGPIKTATALGGALLVVRDAELLERMRALESNYPLQPVSEFAAKVARFVVLKLLSTRWIFGLLYYVATLLGKELDQMVGGAARGFAPGALLQQIRRRASAPLLVLLARRLRTYPGAAVARRAEAGRRLSVALRGGPLYLPGVDAPAHAWWVFPACVPDPFDFCRRLREFGFDATPGASAMRVIAGRNGSTECCPGARRVLKDVMYLPVQPGLTDAEIDRLADSIRAIAATRGDHIPNRTGS